jgi:hypothetical protein
LIIEQGLCILVEAGHSKRDNGILQLFKKLQEKPEYSWLKNISFIQKDFCAAIQLADLLAFYSRRYADSWLDYEAGVKAKLPRMDPILECAKEEIRTIGNLAEEFVATKES